MNSTWLTTLLLSMAGGTLCLGAVMGTLWPGVALAGISILPWAWEAWLARAAVPERHSIAAMGDVLNKHSALLLDSERRLEEQGQQINSLRNAASLRGTLGG